MDSKKATGAELYIGTAGWDYPDWRGAFYPPRLPKGLHPLTYLSSYFDTVEVNSTFYRPTRADYAKKWLSHVEKARRFSFTVKLWQRFTHERGTPFSREEIDLYQSGITPLAESGRLGAVLAQFPWSFKNTGENRDWLERVMDSFAHYPLVLEVRHSSWNDPHMVELLRARKIGFCNIDQPIFDSSIKPDSRVTSPVGYVRLHGRNYGNWFREDADRNARYDYLYSEEELEPWVEKIKTMGSTVEKLYVITNNHYKSQAAVNAMQLSFKVRGGKVDAPATLIKAYPLLAPIARGKDPQGQMNLF